jgi:HK97 gp10 family phage protein
MADQLATFKGIEEINQVFDALGKRIGGKYLKGVLTKAAKPLVAAAKRHSSHADVTGETTKSIGVVQVRASEKAATIKVGPRRSKPYKGHTAHFQEYGTAPHTITAKPGKFLNVNGHPVKSVQHPGQAAAPFMRPAVDEQLPAVLEEIKAGLREALNNNFKDVIFD